MRWRKTLRLRLRSLFLSSRVEQEECRDARGMALADSIRRDLTYALRALRKSPGFATVAILSLALGIGACSPLLSQWSRSESLGDESPAQHERKCGPNIP
jgi:hypothetical protein